MPHGQSCTIRIGAVLIALLCICATANAQSAKPKDAPSRAALVAMLHQVPELDLYGDYGTKSKGQLAAAAKNIAKQNAADTDAFIMKLINDRADLAGLPFIMGKACTMPADKARLLAEAGLNTRTALGQAPYVGKSRENAAAGAFSGMDPKSYAFFAGLGRLKADAVGPVHQITCVEKSDYRMVMIKRVQEVAGPQATRSLIKMALYDLDADVRAEALQALEHRPREEYRAEVIKAFRHPWAPIARQAAAAAVALKMKEIAPDLKAMLRQPDPAAPFPVKTDDGKEKMMVREMVRINHLRNCMLCHPPIDNAAALFNVGELSRLPVGPVTSMDEELPASSPVLYYAPSPGITLVRADMTYLRQDFSVPLLVKTAGKWPALQRYDFFVRVREATAAEREDHRTRRQPSVHARAVSDALQGLIGHANPLE